MQIFQKQAACLGGVDEAIAFLKLCLTDGYSWRNLEVHALRDGDSVAPRETVMFVTGPFAAFAHLETVYLGVLARRTRVATNTRSPRSTATCTCLGTAASRGLRSRSAASRV